MRPASLSHLIVFLLPLSLGSPAHAFGPDIAAQQTINIEIAKVVPTDYGGSPDIAALVASCVLVQNAIKRSPDGNVLCFDGRIRNVPLDEVRKLNNGGTFVARSQGGSLVVAMLIADILKEKNATVVLHGYCLSACANAFLVASHETHVARWTIVAWHGSPALNFPCPMPPEYFRQDDDAEATRKLYCLDPEPLRTFYQRRGIKDDFARQPQTRWTRQMVHLMRREVVDKRSVFWMWHPENFGSYFKSKITFQSFPRSQEQLNRWLRDLGLNSKVVYDPPENE